MPFSTEISSIKAEIASGLAASQYTAKDLVYVSKAIEALSNAENAASNNELSELTITSMLYVGANAANFETVAALTNPVAVFETSATDFAQIAFKNSGSSANSSTDVILYSNNGDDNHGWIDIGITSSNFSDPQFTITGKGDGYIFVSGATGGQDNGNLILATDSTGLQNKIIFAAGGLASDDTQMSITPNQNVHIEIPTPSTSPSTGALTVVGGVGIQGDVNIQGDITFGGTGTTLTTTTLTVTDPVVRVGSGNTSDAVDLGIVGEYKVGGVTKYSGVVRDASDGIVKFFKDTTVAPSSGTINFSGAGLAYADIKIGAVEAASATIGSVTNTEIGYLSGVTSGIQAQINSKANSSALSSLATLASPAFTGNSTFTASSGVPVKITNTGTGDSFLVEDDASTDASPFVINASGNVGVGTTNPNYKVDIRGGRLSVINAESYHIGVQNTTGVNGVWIGSPSADVMQWSDWGGAERMRLNTASATARLQLATGTVLEAPLAISARTSTSETLTLPDAGRLVECSNTSAVTLTVPLNSSIAFPIGTQIPILQTNTGQVTVVGTAGVTVNATPGLKLRAQWSSATLIKRATDTWILVGDLVA